MKNIGNLVRVPGDKLGQTVTGKIVRVGRSGLIHVKHDDGTTTAHPEKHIFSPNLDDENYKNWSGRLHEENGVHESRGHKIIAAKLALMKSLKTGIQNRRELKVGDRVHGDYPGDEKKDLHITYIHSGGKVKLADHEGVAQPNYRNPENLRLK